MPSSYFKSPVWPKLIEICRLFHHESCWLHDTQTSIYGAVFILFFFLSFQVMTLFFHDNGKYFLLRNQKYLYIKNMNALMYQLGKILFILNVLRLKEFIHLWAELFSLRSLSYIIFFNLKGQGLNSCFAIQSKKKWLFSFLSLFLQLDILDLLSLSI